MSQLRAPLRDVAEIHLDDVTEKRLWRGVAGRRERRRTGRVRRNAFVWLAAGALAGAALTLALTWRRAEAPPAPVAVAGPLTVEGGKAWTAGTAPPDAPRTVTLSDGSRLVLDPGAALDPLENTARVVALLLSRGKVTFDVHPGGPRRWSVECGLATVEVVGTSFSLDRTARNLVVEVTQGTVLVRGDRVPGRVQRLVGGARLEVVEPEATALPADDALTRSDGAAANGVERARQAGAAWRDLAKRGNYDDAYRILGPHGLDAESSRSGGVADLMALADVARLSGHPGDAVTPLARVVREFPSDSRAPLAAFTLGKIELAAGRARSAARSFRRAIDLGVHRSLLEDAYSYWTEAALRAGDAPEARSAADRYAAAFPKSSRALALRRRVAAP